MSSARNVASYSRQSQGQGQVQKKTPYCDICFKKGMPPSQYQSHYPKSIPGPNGVVTCPTILAANCNYCGKSGHWANEKYCSALRRDNNQKERDVRNERKEAPNVEKNRMNVNRFAVLDEESDIVLVPLPVGVPAVCVPAPIDSSKPSWASMVKKPVSLRPVEKVDNGNNWAVFTPGNVVVKSSATRTIQSEEARQEALKIIAERKASGKYCSWAESSSDEDEGDDVVEDVDEDW